MLDVSTVIASHRGYVRALLGRMGVPPAHLDDAEQDVFLVLVRRRQHYDAAYSYRQWLSGITRRVAASIRRKEGRVRWSGLATADAVAPARTEPAVEARELVGMLDPGQRDVWLAGYQGYTAAEIARSMALPVTTVQWRLRVARRRLRAAVRGAGRRCRGFVVDVGRLLGSVQRMCALSGLAGWTVVVVTLATPSTIEAADTGPDPVTVAPMSEPAEGFHGWARAHVPFAPAPPRSTARRGEVRLGLPEVAPRPAPRTTSIAERPQPTGWRRRRVTRRPPTAVVVAGDPTVRAGDHGPERVSGGL